MRKNKVLACMLTAAMVMTGVTLPGESGWSTVAAEAAEAGYTFTYENFGCTYLEDGTIEISKYNGSDAEVVIPEEIDGTAVTSIGDKAFYSCSRLTSIEIPDSVTEIGISAFCYCSRLTSIELPDGVTSIGYCAFSFCERLTSIELPEGLTSIGVMAFRGCYGLTNIELPDGVTSIGEEAFYYCTNLTSIELPEGLTSIGRMAFADCSSLTSIELPDGVTSIGDRAFFSCDSLTSIGVALGNQNYSSQDGILYNKSRTELICCPAGKEGEVIILEGVTSIGMVAIYDCRSLTSIELPDSVTEIEDGAFFSCSSLTSIEVALENESYSSQDGILYNKNRTELICCPIGKEGEVIIPEGVTEIGYGAFLFCNGLTSIELPEGVTEIGDGAFYYCSRLTSIELPDSVSSIGSEAFSYCSRLTSIELPKGVSSIGDVAFSYCSSLTSIELPKGVTEIGDGAFYDCSLTEITIPARVKYIGEYALGYYAVLDEKLHVYVKTKIDDFTIYGYIGTAAESYALENGFTFIALGEITLGDVNEDGSIDYFDAMAVLQYDAEVIELTDEQLLAGDVNHDGSVDSFDAVKILQYDAELIESFK